MNSLRLRDDVWLQLEYDDASPFGSMVSGRLENGLRALFDPLVAPLVAADWHGVDHAAVCRAVREATAAFHVDAQTLRDDFLYPDPRLVTPRALVVHAAGGVLGRLVLPEGAAADLAGLVGDWQQGVLRPGCALSEAMRGFDAFTSAPAKPLCEAAGAAWVGHACVLVGGEGTRVLVDPFLPAYDAAAAYRPASLSQLGPDLVLITHSHPDHFDLGTLLRLGPDCDIVVPRVPRESVLSIDMAARLRQLGFRRVHSLGWQERLTRGDVTVLALPFHGEQPGDGERLHPELRNIGNLYTVTTATLRVAFTADAGTDAGSDLRAVAAADRRQHGPVDALFAGCRAWTLYPAQLLRSSVRRYALFVPAQDWTRRHQLMAGPHEALDVAEAWGAGCVVPYADGGAPWYWALGLGPDLSLPGEAGDDSHFDPPPEALLHAARARSSWGRTPIASPVPVRILRPGEALAAQGGLPLAPAQRWPYPRVSFDEFAPPREEELVAVGRKKALLRVLALELATLRGIDIPMSEVQALSNHVRRVAGLTRREDMLQWLERTNLSLDDFTELMQEWARCNALEAAYADQVERRLPGPLALHAMRNAAAFVRRPA